MTWWLLWIGCGATVDAPSCSAPPPPEAPSSAPRAPLLRTVDVCVIDAERRAEGGDALVVREQKIQPGGRVDVAQQIVDRVFAGPGEEGLLSATQGATGGTVHLEGRVASVTLQGPCRGAGVPNVHEQLVKSLRGVEGIAYVRTVDPGAPLPPLERTSHRAECLEP